MTREDITIRIGGIGVSRTPAIIRTTLGSCIAACLYDPVAQVGGMNHFMLPEATRHSSDGDPARYGLHAMELLVGALQRLGAVRSRLLAKLFGGGHVLATTASSFSVAAQNVAFIERYVREEHIHVVAHDLGGTQPRVVHFFTESGRAKVKRLGSTAVAEIAREEFAQVDDFTAKTNRSGDVTLFDP